MQTMVSMNFSELHVNSNQDEKCLDVRTELPCNSVIKIIDVNFLKCVIIDDYAPYEKLDGYDFGAANNGKPALIPRYRYITEVNS